MLIIHESAEERFAQVRWLMTEFDRQHRADRANRSHLGEFHEKLDYLRTYNCHTPDRKINESISVCALGLDMAPFSFSIDFLVQGIVSHSVSIPQRTQDSGLWHQILQMYPRRIMQGGFIYSGPKTVEEFKEMPYEQILKPFWGIHT